MLAFLRENSQKMQCCQDPGRMSKIIIDSADQNPAPKRIALGSDAYVIIRKALTERLATLEGQKELALSTDFSKNA